MRRALFAFALLLVGGTAVAGSATPAQLRTAAHFAPTVVVDQSELTAKPQKFPAVAIPAPLVDPTLDLRAPPVPIPLHVLVPSQAIDVPTLATGLSGPDNVVDAPKGPEGDPIWTQAFWYRGSGIPGDSGTAAIAGHVDDAAGKLEPFDKLKNVKAGDEIVIRDPRANLDVHFTVTETHSFTEKEASEPATLARIYGAGPAAGRGPQHSQDGVSHLTLMTCAGDFVNGSFNHRLVVFADRTA